MVSYRIFYSKAQSKTDFLETLPDLPGETKCHFPLELTTDTQHFLLCPLTTLHLPFLKPFLEAETMWELGLSLIQLWMLFSVLHIHVH